MWTMDSVSFQWAYIQITLFNSIVSGFKPHYFMKDASTFLYYNKIIVTETQTRDMI